MGKFFNPNMFWRAVLDRRVSLAIYCLGVAAYSVMIISIWPSMQDSLDTLQQLWENYPEGLKAAFGATTTITSFDGFVTLEYFTLMWIIIVAPFTIAVSTSAFAGDIEKGTMELLLSQPIPRRVIAFTRMAYLEMGLVLIIAATMLPIVIGAYLVDEPLSTAGLLSLSLLGFLFYLSIGALGFMFSSMMNDRGRAVFLVVGVLIFGYALDLLSEFSDFIDNFHFLSLFNYYDPYRFFHSADIAWGDLAVLLSIVVIADIIAVVVFKRRDIAV